jgi:hypothetical protein
MRSKGTTQVRLPLLLVWLGCLTMIAGTIGEVRSWLRLMPVTTPLFGKQKAESNSLASARDTFGAPLKPLRLPPLL